MSRAIDASAHAAPSPLRRFGRASLFVAGGIVVSALVWQGVTASGNPSPAAAHISPGAAILDTGLLVFREGLETILVLSAITASMVGANQAYRRPIAGGAAMGFAAVLVTWFAVVGILSSLMTSIPALALQAGTGLLAVVVLLVVMNWFFHKVYWTGWISLHNRRKRALMRDSQSDDAVQSRLLLGLAVLGFTSVYREGFEVVLFLQTLRMQVGSSTVLVGVLIGLFFTGAVAVITFFAHQRLPYKRMLVLTGVLLGVVLLVMVGEQAQEMQLAGWLATTHVNLPIPGWMGLWFAVYPTVQTLVAQLFAAVFVIGSYFLAQYVRVWRSRRLGQAVSATSEASPAANALGEIVA
jgi:high-affinity iron transporter